MALRAAFALAVLGKSLAAEEASRPTTFRLAYVASSFYPDGSPALWGQNSLAAIRIALEDANRGGWCGPACSITLDDQLVFEANGTAPSAKLDAFIESAVDAGVVAILGADWGRVAASALASLDRLGASVPLISAGATGAPFGEALVYPNFLRTVYSDSDGVGALLKDLSMRADLGANRSGKLVVIFSNETLGQAGLASARALAPACGFASTEEAGFPSGASLLEVRRAVRSVLPPFTQEQPVVFVSATGPDTTTALKALAAEGVHGPPRGDFAVGALEAAASTVRTAEEASAFSGYASYLGDAPPVGSCAAADDFAARFRGRVGRAPTGGFATYSYDAVVLAATGLRAARHAARTGGAVDGAAVLRAVRGANFAVQGLGSHLAFPNGKNQPCNVPIQLRQLLPGFAGNTYHEAKVATTARSADELCPRTSVAGDLAAAARHCPSSGLPPLRLLCPVQQQLTNACAGSGASPAETSASVLLVA